MIEYFVPTTRGEFTFTWASTSTESNVAGGPFSGSTIVGSTSSAYTVTPGQTSRVSSFSSSSTSSTESLSVVTGTSNSSSGTYSVLEQNSFFLTTTTTESFELARETTSTEEVSTSLWTTSLDGTSTIFTTSNSTTLNTFQSFVDATLTRFNTSELTDTVLANVQDTVCRADDDYLDEYLLSIINTSPATNWDGVVRPPGTSVISTNQATIEAQVATTSVLPYDSSVVSSQVSVAEVTRSLPYHVVSFGTEPTVVTEAEYSVLPNTEKTIATRQTTASLVEEEYTWTAQSSRTLEHYGNTSVATVLERAVTTRAGVITLDAGSSTFSSLYRNRLEEVASFLVSSTYTDAVLLPAVSTNSNISVGGNSSMTISQTPLLIIQGAELDIFGRNLPQTETDYSPAQARCSVFGTWGAVLGSESGGRFTISGTTLTGDFTAAVGRTVESNFTRNARQAVTIRGQTNNSYTIASNSISWTTTDGTASQIIGVDGQTRSGLITTKSVLGGEPASGETFVQAADPWLYTSGTTTTSLSDDITVISHPESQPTSYLRPLNYLGVGTPFNQYGFLGVGNSNAIVAKVLKHPSA